VAALGRPEPGGAMPATGPPAAGVSGGATPMGTGATWMGLGIWDDG